MTTFDDDSFSVLSAAKLSCEELLDLQIKITGERDVAEMDLTQARTKLYTEGVRADPLWFRTTEATVRRKKRQLQWINNRIAEIRKVERQQSGPGVLAFYENFYQIARERLDERTFRELEVAAQVKVAVSPLAPSSSSRPSRPPRPRP